MLGEMSIYKRRKEASLWWYNKSSDLRASAAALKFSCDPEYARTFSEQYGLGQGFIMGVAVRSVYLMLCGMSLELLFKAIVVERGLVVNDSSHELVAHASSAGVKYSSKEKKLLLILTHSIVWQGRYPTPKKEGPWDEFSKLVGESLYSEVHPNGPIKRRNGALDWNGYEILWFKAARAYGSARVD